jgi:hypothetical protein
VDKIKKRMGIDVVVWDSQGEVLATLSAPKPKIFDLGTYVHDDFL